MTHEFTKQAIRYLLGELSENEQSAVEERFFTDADYSRFLDSVENDLIDDYISGKLDFRQMQSFEHNFLISERRREAVRFKTEAQTLVRVNSVLRPHSSSGFCLSRFFRIPHLAWAGVLAAIVFLILTGGLWLLDSPQNYQITQIEINNPMPIVESSKSPSGVLPPTNEIPPNANLNKKQLAKPAPKPNLERNKKPPIAPRIKPRAIPSLTLSPPTQSAEKPLIVRTRNAENIRLRVVHNNAENFIKYLIVIHAKDGDLIWSREIAAGEKTLQKPLALNVRSGALASGTYELTISGATDDGQLEETNTYNFVVCK